MESKELVEVLKLLAKECASCPDLLIHSGPNKKCCVCRELVCHHCSTISCCKKVFCSECIKKQNNCQRCKVYFCGDCKVYQEALHTFCNHKSGVRFT